MVGLEDVAHKMPAGVSGGQQQAAAIARAMANDPPLIVADEPTGNLDSRTAENIFEIFENLAGRAKPSWLSPTILNWPAALPARCCCAMVRLSIRR